MKLKRNYLFGTTVLAGLVAISIPAGAQAQQAASDGSSATQVEEIVVTGSRIRRNDLTSSSPLAIVSSETIDNKGFTNVAQAINQQAGRRCGDHPRWRSGRVWRGPDLRQPVQSGHQSHAGARQRPSFRWVQTWPRSSPAPVLAARLISRPSPRPLIDRVETIQATGGAVYGSDAVAGVINVITKKTYQGLEANVEYGISDRSDADQTRVRLTGGANLFDDRLNIAGSYEYAETDSLGYMARPRTALQMIRGTNPLNTSPTDGIPAQVWYYNRRIPEITQGGLPFVRQALRLPIF